MHGVPGMFGSLDCMHTYWKNCPVAWQQSFKGKASGPTIVMEAIADCNLWFWHISYGYSGALNDLNILNQSPLLKKWTNGTFSQLDRSTGVVPFNIPGTAAPFDRLFVFVDGIYPKYSRMVNGCKIPVGDREIKFTEWQESARKDVERSFGVLQGRWKVLANPIHTIRMDYLS
jgi:Plant transposon protein